MLLLSMPHRIAFLDTNTFLHYQTPDHIDWPTILGADFVVLVIAPVVIRELNKHKDSPSSPKLRDRAADALKRLHDWSEGATPIMIRQAVELRFRLNDPLIDFAAEKLSLNVPDDHLLASAIECRIESPGSDIAVITEDLGLKLRAKAHAIAPVQLPTGFRLPDELSAEEKKIRQLESEVRRLRDRIPLLRLAFEGGEDHLAVAVEKPRYLSREEISQSMEHVRADYSKIETRGAPINEGPMAALLGFTNISAEDVAKYNQALETFYKEYEEYLQRKNEFQNVLGRTSELSIVIINEGTCPAEDIDVFMHFPNGFELLNEDNLPKEPPSPSPPRRPQSPIEALAGIRMMSPAHDNIAGFLSNPYREPSFPARRNVSVPCIRRTKSYDVGFGVDKLKHGFQESSDPLYVMFETVEDALSFSIDYRIHAANMPDVKEDKLHVIVKS